MSEPAWGEIRRLGAMRLAYRWTRCPRCSEGWWRLLGSQRRTCRRCLTGRPNPFD
jgi:hypothetical protein